MFNSLRSEQDAWTNCVKVVLGLLGKKKIKKSKIFQISYAIFTYQSKHRG